LRFKLLLASLAAFTFFGAGAALGLAAFFGAGSGVGSRDGSLQYSVYIMLAHLTSSSCQDTDHCISYNTLALLTPFRVRLEKSVWKTKLLLCARSHTLDSKIFVFSGLVNCENDIAQFLRYDSFGRHVSLDVRHFGDVSVGLISDATDARWQWRTSLRVVRAGTTRQLLSVSRDMRNGVELLVYPRRRCEGQAEHVNLDFSLSV
jgi:hypothetical protein